jgi:phosphate:Na+ symporter
MAIFNTIISILAAIILFLFSLGGFSRELQEVGADRRRLWLSKVTQNRFGGFFLGIILTALIQSSSAVTSITVSLVDAEVISFANSLAVLIGSNLGTTFTAWLVAFKLENLGSWLLVLGTLLSLVPFRIKLIGKSIFYLGLILFSLQEINSSLKPLSQNPEVIFWLSKVDNLFLGILIGAVLTALLQSSSVTTGLTIILASQEMLSLPAAFAIVVGCNIGTTSTALLASISLSKSAKRTATANLIFNFAGLLFFVPSLRPTANCNCRLGFTYFL